MMEVTFWIILITVDISLSSVFSCTFPQEWHGQWYQSSFGDLNITANEISRKGICKQKSGNKYLISSRDQNCHKCLVIKKWHDNILQYKESFCSAAASLDSICNNISGDAPLHTIVRIQSVPVPCPFHGYYTFGYVNNTNKYCELPRSEMQACADESKFKFKYRRCPGMPETNDKELYFQCLATWENGEKYLYGKFTGARLMNREQMYRCFMHSFYGSLGDMSMSADATCQGLQSPSVGIYTMRLEYDRTQWPSMRCTFPDFFILRKTWRDLSERYRMLIDDGLQIFRIKDKYPTEDIIYSQNEVQSNMKMVLRCVDTVEDYSHTTTKEFIVHTTDDKCTSTYRCLRLRKRNDKVLELYIGAKMDDPNTPCDEELFTRGEKHILIPDDVQPTTCPTAGNYEFTDKTSDCEGRFMLGCNSDREIEVESRCSANFRSVKIFQCLIHWKEEKTHYVIVQKSANWRKPATCLAFTEETDNEIEVQEDEFCIRKTMVSNKAINYVLFKPSEQCINLPPPTDTVPPKGITSDRTIDKNKEPEAGGSSGIINANNSSERLRTCVVIYFLLGFTSMYLFYNR